MITSLNHQGAEWARFQKFLVSVPGFLRFEGDSKSLEDDKHKEKSVLRVLKNFGFSRWPQGMLLICGDYRLWLSTSYHGHFTSVPPHGSKTARDFSSILQQCRILTTWNSGRPKLGHTSIPLPPFAPLKKARRIFEHHAFRRRSLASLI
jgi:hypothetical protein